MLFKITISILCSILAGILYRMGGANDYNTKFRDLGVSYIMYINMLAFVGLKHWLSLLWCFVLLFASLTTYWKKDGKDAYWYNWLFTGLGYSLAMLPFSIVSHNWLGFYLRTALLTLFIMCWSETMENAIWEEFGRGFFINATLPLLLI